MNSRKTKRETEQINSSSSSNSSLSKFDKYSKAWKPLITMADLKSTDVYNDMNLYLTAENFYIEPNGSSVILLIDRLTSQASLHAKSIIPTNATKRPVCGILGTIQLIGGNYLIVATLRILVGTINGQMIWQLAGTDIIPYARSMHHLSREQFNLNQTYENMVRQVLDTPKLYFSYTYDLSHTLQRLHNTTPDFLQMSLFERSDPRFVWNGAMLNKFVKPGFKRYCLPLVQGFVSINDVYVNGKIFTWSIISRRSVHRAGCRLFCRGVDPQGYVANFVETEQIVEYNGDRSSFVQTRGSIPLFWQQLPNLKYKPSPKLIPGQDQQVAFVKHLDSQLQQYGKQVLVNLINQTGSENVLEKAFSNMVSMASLNGVRYEAFDFHAECRHMKWERLNILIDRLAHEQDEFSCFMLRRDGTLVSVQDGVFRTNCIDCLDRTNVVQSMLARRSLTSVLQKLGVLDSGERVEDQTRLEALFKSVWADNADMVSIQYSGTGALKTDFTRTGKRTKVGLLKDGMNSMIRYYMNNFSDGYRQDSIDLFLGNYQVLEGEGATVKSPLQVEKGWRYITFPSVLLFAISMFFASAIFPQEYSTEVLLYLLFWGTMIGTTLTFIMIYGKEFVDSPKLRDEFRTK